MGYHSNPIDEHGFLSSSKVVHFPKEPTMGYVLVSNSLNPYPPSVGVQDGGDPEDHVLPSNKGAFETKWLENKWSRFQKSPNIVFPPQAFNKVANITQYSSGLVRDASITSWVIELWVYPDGVQDKTDWTLTEASNRYTLLQLGGLIDNNAGAGYPYSLGSDVLHTGIFFYQDIYPLIYWSMKTGDASLTPDKDDFKFEYLFDSSRLLQLNAWNHLVFEWHYGGTEANPADGWEAYRTAYDPTCRVWVNGDEAMRGLKEWVIDVPYAVDLYDEVSNVPSFVGGNLSTSTHFDCEGLPLTEIGYLGGRCQQHDAGKSGGWQSTGSLITDEDARTFDATTGVATSFDWVDYNFKGFMTEFRIWKNKRVSDVGYHVRNTTSPSNIPSPYSSKRLKGNEDGLVAYYPMNEGVGDILYDLTMENNIPARLIKTPKTKRFYPEDANADAVNNIRWNQPPDGLRFLEPDDTQSLFIKQNRVHPVLSFNPSNKQYDSDIVTFGEIYDTVQDVGITNFSFTDSKNQRLAPQIGDYLLMKWNVDPSCLKRDMLQTMTNIVTISLPYYREPYPIVLDMFYESEEVPDEPPAPTGPDDTQENWIASLFAGPEPSNWLSKDHSSGVRFTYDTVSVDYEAYLGFNSYRYNDATNEAFENIFTPKSAHSNLAMKDFDYEDYYFILHISYGNNRRKSYHSKNAIPFVLNDVIRDDYTKPIWGMLGDSSNVPIQRSQEDIKQSMVAHILEPSFGGQGTVNDPHVLTLKIPYDDSSNRIQSTLKTARLEVYNKFTTLTKSGELVSNTPKVAFGPTPYGELAFFKREN